MDAFVNEKIRVFLIDDHPIFRECLASVLAQQPDLEVVGQEGTAADALKSAAASLPQVILVDLDLPDRDGVELIALLRAQLPRAKLLVLSAYQDKIRVGGAFDAGADGYMVKTCKPEDAIAGIRSIFVGGAPLSVGVATSIVDLIRNRKQRESVGIEALSKRESQVFRLLAEGTSTQKAAALLGISHKTVETHRSRIYAKLGCKSAVGLAHIAFHAGLLKP